MDTQILFNVNQALEAWRSTLPAMSPDDRAELEGHLVDSMTELGNAGLSQEEAFWLARRRLGEAVDTGGLPGAAGGTGADATRSESPIADTHNFKIYFESVNLEIRCARPSDEWVSLISRRSRPT